MKYLIKPSLTLLITAVLTIALLSFVHAVTLEPIEAQQMRVREAAMREVFPAASSYIEMQIEPTGNITNIYEAVDGVATAGYVVALSPEGYSGKIDIMVGVSVAGNEITGMRVLRHTETPGLGALCTKESFYRRFDGRGLIPISVVKTGAGENEIDAITAATITTKAITDAVNEAIAWYTGRRGSFT